MTTVQRRYLILAIGGLLGLVAAFLQTIEKLVLIENKDAILPCNISDVFSCSVVLSAPQSSLFGFPNSLICLIIFTIFATVGAVGLVGSELLRRVNYVAQGLAIFMLLFALWFLLTSTYVIEAVCIFCLICLVGLLLINAALWRLNFSDMSPRSHLKNILAKVTQRNIDIFVWVSIAVILMTLILMKFYIFV